LEAISDSDDNKHVIAPAGTRPEGEIPRRHSSNSRVY